MQAAATTTTIPTRGLTAVPMHFKIGALAARLSVRAKSIRRWIADGEFPNAVRPGDCWLIPESDVIAFLTRHRWRDQKDKEGRRRTMNRPRGS